MPGARRPILTDSRRNRNPYVSRGGYVDSRRDYAGRRMGTYL